MSACAAADMLSERMILETKVFSDFRGQSDGGC